MDVLIIQQDEVVSTILTGTLARAGYRPYILDDAFACYETLQNKDGAAIVLLDKRDPNLDINSLCQLIRNTDIGFQPFLISICNALHENEVEAALLEGVDDIIPLPLNSGLLLAKMAVAKRWLQWQMDQQEAFAKVKANAMFNDEMGVFNAKAGKMLIGKELSRLRLLANSYPNVEVYPEFFSIRLINMAQILADFGDGCLNDVMEQLSIRLQRFLRGSDILFQLENDVIGCFVTSYHPRNSLGQDLYEACVNEPYVLGNIHFTMMCRVAVVGLANPPMQLVTEIFAKSQQMHQQLAAKDSLPVLKFTFKNDAN